MVRSDGYVEARQFDVVHFPTQVGYLTKLPTIYQPHDLQHLHYPQFFSEDQFAQREREYRAFCDQATFVCVQTEWTKQDVIANFQIAPEKIVVIPWGPVFEAYENSSIGDIRGAIDKFGLPATFFFYPAVTWPHKNHEVIFRALRILKDEHRLIPNVYFTGSSNTHRPILHRLARDLGVSDQLHFLGFVSPSELQSIYKTATAMIYPSKFEGFGLPILEAFHAELPVLAANATTVPELAQEGALYFDPDSPRELSELMKHILEKPEVRQNLTKAGTRILSTYSIAETARKFKALYTRTAEVSKDDQLTATATNGYSGS